MMVGLRNIFHLGIKEFHSFRNDKVLLLFVIWAFSGGIYAAATATSQELHHAPLAMVDEDGSQLSHRIMDGFYRPYFKPPEVIRPAEMDPGLDSGRYTFVMVIPSRFERDVRAGRPAEIQVNIDATQMSQAFIGASYIQSITLGEVTDFVQGFRGEAATAVDQAVHVKFNPNLTHFWFGSVMEIINNVTLLSIVLTGAALIREREHGTIEHLLVMPLTPAQIMAAKVWSNGLIVLVGAGLSLWLMVQKVLAVPIAGSVGLFLFGAALHLFSTTSMGIFLGTVARSMPQMGLLMILLLLPLLILSGGITPRESMPRLVQQIMQLSPTTHFVALAQAVLYRGAGWAVVWPRLVAIMAIGALFFVIALLRFRKSITMTQV